MIQILIKKEKQSRNKSRLTCLAVYLVECNQNIQLYMCEQQLNIYVVHTNICSCFLSCPSSSTDRVSANVGSSLKLTFIFDLPVQHSTIEFHYSKKSNSRRVINITINADIYIKNVTHEDEGFYELELDFFREIQLKVASK